MPNKNETYQKLVAPIHSIFLQKATFQGTKEEVTPTLVNFFYGDNGTGKSTIANAILHDEGVAWSAGLSRDKFDVLLYNQAFIAENFSDYGDLKGVFTLCSDNKEKEEEAREKNAIKKAIDAKIEVAKNMLSEKEKYRTSLLTTLQDTLFEMVKPLRTEFSKVAEGTGRKDSLYKLIKDVKVAVAPKKEEIENIYQVAYKGEQQIYRLFARVNSSFAYGNLSGYALLSKVIVSSGDTPFSEFMNALGASSWVRQGHLKYASRADGNCPFCQQKLPDNFEEEIARSFDEEYQKDLNAIKSFQDAYTNETKSILKVLSENLSHVLPSIDLATYKEKLSLLQKNISLNIERIASKIEKPSSIVSLEDTDSVLLEMGTIIDEINEQIKANNDVVADLDNEKKHCKQMFKEYIVSLAQPYIEKYDENYEKATSEVKKAEEAWKELAKESLTLAQEIAELNKNIKNTTDTVKQMNETLKKTGFQGFYLRERADNSNHYEVIRQNGEVAENLSAGERNFIAFLYFYHLVEGSTNPKEDKPKIVVIDDPVTSMDQTTLSIVASLVRDMIKSCRDSVYEEGALESGAHIKQIFIFTHNVYFHSEVTYQEEKNFDSTSFFQIIKRDNISHVIPCIRKAPARNNAYVNYNPVQNSYQALWKEFKETQTLIPLLNVMRKILATYFIKMCGYDGKELRLKVLEGKNKKLFMTASLEGAKVDPTKYQLANNILSCIHSSTFFDSEIHLLDDERDIQLYKDVFKIIFYAMEHSAHYKMMMEVD